MISNSSDDKKKYTVDFLRDEYNYLTRLFVDNEALGERRVTFFMSIATAVISVLTLVIGSGNFSSAIANSTPVVKSTLTNLLTWYKIIVVSALLSMIVCLGLLQTLTIVKAVTAVKAPVGNELDYIWLLK